MLRCRASPSQLDSKHSVHAAEVWAVNSIICCCWAAVAEPVWPFRAGISSFSSRLRALLPSTVQNPVEEPDQLHLLTQSLGRKWQCQGKHMPEWIPSFWRSASSRRKKPKTELYFANDLFQAHTGSHTVSTATWTQLRHHELDRHRVPSTAQCQTSS